MHFAQMLFPFVATCTRYFLCFIYRSGTFGSVASNNSSQVIDSAVVKGRSTPVAQLAPRNLLTRWDVSSIPANGIFLTKN